MGRIKLDHWFINDNELSISLMRYYVDINISYDEKVNILLRVIDSDRKELFFDFDSLEKAIIFTEAVINKCPNYQAIEDAYNNYYREDKTKKLIR